MSSKIQNTLLIDLCARTVLCLVRDLCEIEASGDAEAPETHHLRHSFTLPLFGIEVSYLVVDLTSWTSITFGITVKGYALEWQ